MLKLLILIAIAVASTHCLVVFKSFKDPACSVPMWPYPRLYFPVTDRNQGIDSQVAGVIYGNNPPSTFGNWTVINTTAATLCSFVSTKCQTWTVWPDLASAKSECVMVPPFGWGHFYNTGATTGAMELRRTTGQSTFFDPSVCRKPESYQWVAYLHSPVVSSTAPCSNNTFVPQVFWDGGDKLTFYLAGAGAWTQTQPCGDAPYPGEKCFGSGEGYCTKNANCAIDHKVKPNHFPFSGFQATTVKVVMANKAGSVSKGIRLGASVILMVAALLLIIA